MVFLSAHELLFLSGFLEADNTHYYFLEMLYPSRKITRMVGHLIVTDHLVTKSFINIYFRGQGLGRLLYLHALEDLGSLSTDFNMASDKAIKMWKFLTEHLEHDYSNGILTVWPNEKGYKSILCPQKI